MAGLVHSCANAPDLPVPAAPASIYRAAMPSPLHEALLELFRNRPALAPELLRDALQVPLPDYTDARIDSAELNLVQPAEYRADLVVLLLDDEPVLGIVVEVQLAPDTRKDYVWPVYVAGLRARLECPVCLLVVAATEATARWANRVIEMGGPNLFTPFVLGPAGIPEITDPATACADPELAVLSAIAHGRDMDVERSIQIAFAAQQAAHGLDADRSKLYFDLIQHALSEGARRALQNMALRNYEYQSEFARTYVAQGRREGRADLLSQLLVRRFGALPETVRTRLAAASVDELDAIGERLLSAQNLEEALGSSIR